jgi:hypothetical protein
MLQEKYLPVYHFKIFHEISVAGDANELYEKMLQTKTTHWLVKLLFWLRGIHITDSPGSLSANGFDLLEEIKGEEKAYGIVSTSSYFGSCVEHFKPIEFNSKYAHNHLRGIIVFGIRKQRSINHLFTETRIHCGSRKIYIRFRIYWFFVKPFSSLIRKLMLKELARKK